MATVPNQTITSGELDPITQRTLDAFRRRRGLLLLLRAVGVGLLVFVSLTLLLATVDYLVYFPDWVRWVASLAIYATTLMAVWFVGIASMRQSQALQLARHLESVAPHLREDLVSAVELAEEDTPNGSPYFRHILQSRVARRISKVDVGRALPIALVSRWLFSGLSVSVFVIAMMFIPSAQFGRRFARASLPGLSIERASRTRVTILQPSPASRYVAERDAVGVIATVSGLIGSTDQDAVMLHWRSDDGAAGSTPMVPRMDASDFQPGNAQSDDTREDAGSTGQHDEQRFAANLSVGSVPMQYRITAGDAITLWYDLTPLKRPRVLGYQKTYHMPAYANLSDRTATEEHGDLKALQDSTVDLQVNFDQEVESPVIQFGARGAKIEMQPVDESDRVFQATVSIKTSGQYQVDAVGVRSGLSNPFSPTNTITPVIDSPPQIDWHPDTPKSRLVSALDVISLAATVSDDLPLDRVQQQFQINGQSLVGYDLDIDQPARKLDLQWDWDLMKRVPERKSPNGKSPDSKLQTGDVVVTRLVAIDRKGTRIESEPLEILIAGDGFDADRHEFLEPLAKRTLAVSQWANQTHDLLLELQEIAKNLQWESLAEIQGNWKDLQTESVQLVQSLKQALSKNSNSAAASQIELTGQTIFDIESAVTGQLQLAKLLSAAQQPVWQKDNARHVSELARDAKRMEHRCQWLAEFEQARFAMALSAALYLDVRSVAATVNQMVETLPDQRLPRYLNLISGQLNEVDRLVERFEPQLHPNVVRHLESESWLLWSERARIQIANLVRDSASRDQVLAVLDRMKSDLQNKPQQVIDSRLHDTVLRWGRDLRKEMPTFWGLTNELREIGEKRNQLKRVEGKNRTADDAIRTGNDVRWADLVWQHRLNRLVTHSGGQEHLNRAKVQIDLEYAADQNLFSRAIQNVTANGYQDYGEEKANQVLHSIAAAIRILQSSHKVSLASDELQAIAQGEGLGEADPIRKIYHPLWFYLQNIRTELAVRGLTQSHVDKESIIKVIDETRYNDARNQANSKIDSRRWNAEAFVSAEPQLAMLLSDLSLASQRLAPDRIVARETLQKYVTDLVEQAREAAEAAEKAKQETDARDDNSESAVSQLLEKPTETPAKELDGSPADAVEKATETVESLIDKANTTDILDLEQREIARDADAAASWIADAIQETKQAMEQAQQASTDQDREQSLETMEENLASLAERLETTAEHFDRAEHGGDLAESREQLRQAEQAVQAKAELDDRYQRAEQMAEAAKQDPRALLEKLELELQRNEKMQDALDDIAIDMVKESAKRLEQAARDEQELNKRLENGDRAFQEKKRQHKILLNEFKERANSLRERTLGAAAQASGWANEPEQQLALEQIREDLNTAVTQASPAINENVTLGEMQTATDMMQQATIQAAEQAKRSAAIIDKSVDKDLHGDVKRRDQTAAKLRRELNQLKNEEVRAIDRQRGSLNSEEREAGKRVNQANKDARNAEDAMKRAEEKLKKNPNDQGAQNEIDRQQDRLSDAKRFGQEARRTKDLSRERRTKANDRANSLNSKPSSKLEKPNPAAQMAANAAREAAERLEALADDLGELKKQSDIADRLRTRREITEDISNKQRQVQGDIKLSADELARAARHEERMGEIALAKRLDEASEQTSENAGVPAEQAAGKIADAKATPAESSNAGKALKKAAEAIGQQADAIANLLNESVSESADPSSPEDASQAESSESSTPTPSADASQASAALQSGTTPEDAEAKQMAQTLDELDRSLNGQPSQQQPGEQQSGEQQGSQQQGQQQQGSQQQGAAQQGNAMEASPTLARMLEAQRQQAARARMKGLQDTSGETESSQPNQQAEKPTTEAGQGEPPGGKQDVDLLDGEITDGDWGGLRERVVDDANQGKSTRIPPGYSREVQAYFKALSKRAAEATK